MSETVMLTSNPYRRGATASAAAAPSASRCRACGVRVRDDDGARAAAPARSAASRCKGPNVFEGYWRMPEKTREEFTADGWFKTGDVGKVDERGYVTIVGRSKDLIISGGYNVYPAEIEGYINEHAGRGRERGGRRAAPRLRRGRRRGRRRRKPGAQLDGDALIARAEGAASPTSRCPSACFVVDELPRNAMGKVQKNLLREQHKDLFG